MLIQIFTITILILIGYYIWCEKTIETFECPTVNSSDLYKNRDDIKFILSRLSNIDNLRNKINENKRNIENTKNTSNDNNKKMSKINEALKHL